MSCEDHRSEVARQANGSDFVGSHFFFRCVIRFAAGLGISEVSCGFSGDWAVGNVDRGANFPPQRRLIGLFRCVVLLCG